MKKIVIGLLMMIQVLAFTVECDAQEINKGDAVSDEEIQLIDKLGLVEMIYPEFDFSEDAGYFTRLEEGISESTGENQKILLINPDKDKIKYFEETFDHIVPDSSVDILKNNNLTSKKASQYDTIAIYDYRNIDNLESIIDSNKNVTYIIDGDLLNTNEHIKFINSLSKRDNVLVVIGVNIGYFEPFNKDFDFLSKLDVDLYAPANCLFYNGVEKIDAYYDFEEFRGADITFSASVISLLKSVKNIENIQEYVKKHTLESETPNGDLIMKIIDVELLFEKRYNLQKASRAIIPLREEKGDDLLIGIIDENWNFNDKRIKKNIVNKIVYDLRTTRLNHGNLLVNAVTENLPNVKVQPISLERSEQGVQEVLDNIELIESKVIATSVGREAIDMQTNKTFDKILEELANNQDSIVVWFGYEDYNENIITTNCLSYFKDKDDVFLYSTFYKNHLYNDFFEIGHSQITPQVASLVAQLKNINEDLTGKEIVKILKDFGVPIKRNAYLPNMVRTSNFLKSGLEFNGKLTIKNDTNYVIKFDEKLYVRLNGKLIKNTKSIKSNNYGLYTISIDDRVKTSTQILDLNLLNDSEGNLFIDSTFNGTIKIGSKTISVVKGINKITLKKISSDIKIISVNYNLNANK